MDKIGGCD